MRALTGVFRNRAIRRMQLAFLLFNVAEPAMWVAILVYAFDEGGTRAVGLVSILCLVPAGLLAPLAAGLGDRFPRERVVRFGYLTQAVVTGILALASGSAPHRSRCTWWRWCRASPTRRGGRITTHCCRPLAMRPTRSPRRTLCRR